MNFQRVYFSISTERIFILIDLFMSMSFEFEHLDEIIRLCLIVHNFKLVTLKQQCIALQRELFNVSIVQLSIVIIAKVIKYQKLILFSIFLNFKYTTLIRLLALH